MTEKILFECECNYSGFAVMVESKGMKYKHPVCPSCGKLQEW